MPEHLYKIASLVRYRSQIQISTTSRFTSLQTLRHTLPMSSSTLLFSVPGTQLSFRASLLTVANPFVVNLVQQLPLKSVLAHVVISGQTFWMPTRILSLGPGNTVEREPGAVYFHAPGQTICVCYGAITETAKVNQFGRVLQDDFPKLQAVGELIYQQTVASENKAIVGIELSLIGGDANGNQSLVKELAPHPSMIVKGDWRAVKALIEKEIDVVWLEEPDEIRKVRLGMIEGGAGTGNQSFSVLVHLETFLIMDGAHIIFRILQLISDATMTTSQIKNITRVFLRTTFDHFAFFADLGLPTFALCRRRVHPCSRHDQEQGPVCRAD
ncbi:hypothetical protein OG21DRAFT_1035559 [Imleria badia]|nr:hypothetical protein OG21DRAFT_1035559 [Imleria badia]